MKKWLKWILAVVAVVMLLAVSVGCSGGREEKEYVITKLQGLENRVSVVETVVRDLPVKLDSINQKLQGLAGAKETVIVPGKDEAADLKARVKELEREKAAAQEARLTRMEARLDAGDGQRSQSQNVWPAPYPAVYPQGTNSQEVSFLVVQSGRYEFIVISGTIFLDGSQTITTGRQTIYLSGGWHRYTSSFDSRGVYINFVGP